MLPPDEAVARIKAFVEKTYGKRGEAIVARNFAAIDLSLERLARVEVGVVGSTLPVPARRTEAVPDFVARFTSRLLAGDGDLLPVSALPIDGTFPTGTAKYEKLSIAQAIPVWDPTICIDCGKCAMVCPHASIRMKVFPEAAVATAPASFLHKEFRSRELPGHRLTIQVAPDDCTGCGVCVDVCPARSKTDSSHKAIDMAPVAAHREAERERWDVFQAIPALDRSLLPHDTIKGSQVLEPLFEFSGACAGCGETPYIRLVSQLFGDHMVVANATGCSSIYGGNLPTTPWTVDAAGRGPAWSNSLFEDNAEFGLGMRLSLDAQAEHARLLLGRLAPRLDADLVAGLLTADQDDEPGIERQRERVGRLRDALATVDGDAANDARHLETLAEDLVRRSVWIIGGDGWAFDIGFGGLDHVLSSGRNVNVLVLDTEVYSNTGGQASKATPRGAVAKFAAAGKGTARKDLGAIARAYGDVYVAQIAMGASDAQTVKALLEADAWPGPSLVIAYSTCIAHGIDMATSMTHQKDAVRSGYWPLYRFQPSGTDGGHPFKLDSARPDHPDRRLHRRRGAVRDPPADPPRTRRRARVAGAGRRRRTMALLPGARGYRADRAPHRSSGNGGPRGMTVDLRTRYLGLELRSPIVASAAPHNGDPAMARRLEQAGVGAIVLPSLFEEEILAEELELGRVLEQGTEQFAESLGYFPRIDRFVGVADRYLASLEQVKAAVGVPVLASLNASSGGGWVRHAQRIEAAGADALELNLYHLAVDPTRPASAIEAIDLDLVAAVRDAVTIPLAVKLSPYYSALANFATAVTVAGADGLVLFNRFYQPDLDLETLSVMPSLELSRPWEMRLPVRWIAILRPRLNAAVSLALTSGARAGTDVVKGLLVGADVVMMTSALLRDGPEHVATVEAELRAWMGDHEYASVDQLRGSASQATVEDPGAFERANYMQTLRSWTSQSGPTVATSTGAAGR